MRASYKRSTRPRRCRTRKPGWPAPRTRRRATSRRRSVQVVGPRCGRGNPRAADGLALEGGGGAKVVLILKLQAFAMEHLSYAGAHADFLAADAEGAHVPATFQPDPPEKRVYPSKS